MYKKLYDKIKNFIKKDYKQLIILIIIYLILSFPINYYIIVGGGISDINSRVSVDNSYNSKGSFNISYVSELRGNTLTYILSYVIPDWKRVPIEQYQYNNEDYKDLQYRSDLELANANDNAIKTAYTLAKKEYNITRTDIYVTGTIAKFKNKLKIKDEIISIDNMKYNDIKKYKEYIMNTDNKYVIVKVIRNKRVKNIKCKIHKYKSNKILGVTLEQINKYKTNPKVKIKFKDSESGPSGGLITTLDIYNKLTKKDITHSLKIAGTGTVDSDGKIGEIGEVKYKLLGAEKAKADIFLVPSGNYNTCIKLKKSRNLKIKIIKVKSIKDAIRKLNKLSF